MSIPAGPLRRPLVAALLMAALGAQNLPVPARCGLHTSAPAVPSVDHADCDYAQTNPLPIYAPTYVCRIPVVVHMIENAWGVGHLADSAVRAQIAVLNEDFRAAAQSPGANGTDAMVEFYLATVDPVGQPTTGITHHVDDNWYDDIGDYWTPLAWDTERFLNIYTNSGGGFFGYVPDLPQAPWPLHTNADRVVIQWRVFGRPSVYGPPFDGGRTTSHEVGHYLGLFHTFEGGCAPAATCLQDGDRICDTEPESLPANGCAPGGPLCAGTAPIHNYMDYGDDACMTHFTPQQVRRMRCTLQHYRPAAFVPCPVAAASTRNAGTNLAIYQAVAPRLGHAFDAAVALAGTGYQFAALFAFAGSGDAPLGVQGDRLLLDLGSPFVFQTGYAGDGNVASFSFPVPAVTALCGLALASQAFVFGGAPEFRASNAVDLLIGL